jgi:WD40 repeat protein
MFAHKYESAEILSGHTSSITVLLFSPDGEYLASGCESGVVLVTATESWENVKKLVNVSPVTALLWDPTFPMTMVCGFASGAVLTVHIGDSDLVRLRFITAMLKR